MTSSGTRRKRTAGQRKRGRPSLRLEFGPWFEKMHDHVKEGETLRGAASLVTKRYGHEMPQGSRTKPRTFESTVDMLRKKYPNWLEEEAKRERKEAQWAATVARAKRVADSMQAMFDTPEMRDLAARLQPVSERLEHLNRVARDVFANCSLSFKPWPLLSEVGHFSAAQIKPQKRGE